MTRSTLFLAVLASCLAAPALADDSFRSPPASESKAAGKIAAARADRVAKSGAVTAAAVTVEEVGDANSFGKPVKWLGLLSGFAFPYRGMPVWIQWLAELLPPTHFIRLVRGIMLKGNGNGDVSLWS